MRPGLLQPLVCLLTKEEAWEKEQIGRAEGHCAKQLGKLIQDTLFFVLAQRALASSADTSPSCAEAASPISKCLVPRGSRTILFLNGSSIFQQEMAGPTADTALVPLPHSSSLKGKEARQAKCFCRTDPAQRTPPVTLLTLTQLLNDGLGLCSEHSPQ